jgi:hypothetical protein
MKPLLLQPGQIIDVGETAAVFLTVSSSEPDGLNPYCARVRTLELQHPLLIPVDEDIKVK